MIDEWRLQAMGTIPCRGSREGSGIWINSPIRSCRTVRSWTPIIRDLPIPFTAPAASSLPTSPSIINSKQSNPALPVNQWAKMDENLINHSFLLSPPPSASSALIFTWQRDGDPAGGVHRGGGGHVGRHLQSADQVVPDSRLPGIQSHLPAPDWKLRLPGGQHPSAPGHLQFPSRYHTTASIYPPITWASYHQ